MEKLTNTMNYVRGSKSERRNHHNAVIKTEVINSAVTLDDMNDKETLELN